MPYSPPPPAPLAEAAERETWFTPHHAGQVLDWLEKMGTPLLGIDVARKLPDGKWMLLIDPMLDDRDGIPVTIEAGRRFINEHAEPDIMFEPVW